LTRRAGSARTRSPVEGEGKLDRATLVIERRVPRDSRRLSLNAAVLPVPARSGSDKTPMLRLSSSIERPTSFIGAFAAAAAAAA